MVSKSKIRLKKTKQRTQALVPGSYVGPNGQHIQIKRTMIKGGAASDLATKGIIIENRPVDGRYVGPGGANFLVQHGIIIVNPEPSPTIKSRR